MKFKGYFKIVIKKEEWKYIILAIILIFCLLTGNWGILKNSLPTVLEKLSKSP